MTKEFCNDFVTACSGQIDLPSYSDPDEGTLDYCERHTGTQTTDFYWSYPFVEGELCTVVGYDERSLVVRKQQMVEIERGIGLDITHAYRCRHRVGVRMCGALPATDKKVAYTIRAVCTLVEHAPVASTDVLRAPRSELGFEYHTGRRP